MGVFLLAIFAGRGAPAADEGQDDLIRAIRAKLSVGMLADLDEVIRLCESAQAKGLDQEDTRWANKLLAATLIDRGGIYARTATDAAKTRDPKWPDYRRLALRDLERAAPLDPNRPEAPLRIAQLNVMPQGDLKRALAALDDAITRAKDQGQLKAEALVLRAQVGKDPSKQLADLGEAIRIAPGDPEALRTRAALLAGQGKPEAAMADLNAALSLDPDDVKTLAAKSLVLATLKKYDEAIGVVDEAHKLAPNSPDPLVQRALIRAMKGDFKGALADCDEAESTVPRYFKAIRMRASIYQEMKDDARALAEADRLLEARPGDPDAVRFRAGLLAGAHKFDAAIAAMEELSKADPDDAEVLLQLAGLHVLAKRYHKAIAIYSQILRKDPDNATVLHARGDTRLGIGQHAEAIADYEKALKLQPHDSGLLNNFAWVLATSPVDKLRNGKRAVAMALEACQLTEYRQAHILSTLGAAYAESGDFATALKWSQKAVESGTPDQKADLLKELESYKAGKPVRELKDEEAPEGEKPAAAKGE
jgi:tetratricopeptide (TPR) repeat protein